MTSRLTVATYNVGDGPGSRKVTDLLTLSQTAHIIGLQEASDRNREIDTFLDATGWSLWAGDSSDGARAVPLLWDPDVLTADYTETVEAVPPRYVGPKGAGPAKIKRKVLNIVRGEVAGWRLHVINTHFLPSVTRPMARGRRGLPRKEWLARRQHWIEHVSAVEAEVDERTDQVIVMGDFNAEPNFELMPPMYVAGMVSDQDRATHGGRCIDLIWHREHSPWQQQSALTVLAVHPRKLSSDHRAGVVTYMVADVPPPPEETE